MNNVPSNPLIDLIEDVIYVIDAYLVPLVFALALIAFLWGIFNFFIAGGADEEKRENGKKFMVWGFVGFFVMVSVWGIVNLLVSSLGFENTSRPPLPSFEERSAPQQTQTGTSGRSCQDAFDCDGLACLNGFCASGQGVD